MTKVRRPPIPTTATRSRLQRIIRRGNLFEGDDTEFFYPDGVCRMSARHYHEHLCGLCECDPDVDTEALPDAPDTAIQPGGLKPEPCDPPDRLVTEPFTIVTPSDCKRMTLEYGPEQVAADLDEILARSFDRAVGLHIIYGSQQPEDHTVSVVKDSEAVSDEAVDCCEAVGLLMEYSAAVYGGQPEFLTGNATAGCVLRKCGLLDLSTGAADMQTAEGVKWLPISGQMPTATNPAPGPAVTVAGDPVTPLGPGEHWLHAIPALEYDLLAPEFLQSTVTDDNGNTVPTSWNLLLANEFKQMSEVLVITRMNKCGLLSIKVKNCGCSC